ncbi:MAG: hypothetical protein DI629_12460 [Mesorhizobium amorphae]|nr:MAG: hypothetical protein DI629_12460 [Mesorhizobium amorphae]
MLPLALLAAELPALTGRVVDAADMLSAADEARLTQKLAAFERRSSDQIVVATVPDLGGEAIEPYANRLFRAWGLGQAGTNNGILLLVSRDDRAMRIEVGYGLEGTLTDLHSRLIIEDTMVPAFRRGDFARGIEGAVDDITTVLEGNPEELQARRDRNRASERRDSPGLPAEVYLFGLIWLGIMSFSFGSAILPRLFGRKLGPERYEWLGMTFDYSNAARTAANRRRRGGSSWGGGGWSGGSGGGWSSGGSSRSSGGGFSGGGGSSGGGGASGRW